MENAVFGVVERFLERVGPLDMAEEWKERIRRQREALEKEQKALEREVAALRGIRSGCLQNAGKKRRKTGRNWNE